MRDGYPALVELTRARLLEVAREPEALFWMFVFPVLMALALGVAFPSRTTDTVVAAVVEAPGADALAATLSRVPGIEVQRVAMLQGTRPNAAEGEGEPEDFLDGGDDDFDFDDFDDDF